MNTTKLLLGIGMVALGLTAPFAAQTPQHHEDHGAAVPAQTGHMGMGMMNDPAHQTAMQVFVLPELQTELGLSAQQLSDLRQMKQDLISTTKDLAREAKNKELDLTFAKMKAALNEEQRTKLAAMKPAEVHELAMARVPMDEHRIMAGFVTGGMMGGGMMKKGMTKH